MKTMIIALGLSLLLGMLSTQEGITQTPVTDVGAGIQREALWAKEKGILSKINSTFSRQHSERIDDSNEVQNTQKNIIFIVKTTVDVSIQIRIHEVDVKHQRKNNMNIKNFFSFKGKNTIQRLKSLQIPSDTEYEEIYNLK